MDMRPVIILTLLILALIIAIAIMGYLLLRFGGISLHEALMISVTAIPAFVYSALLFWDRLKMNPEIRLTDQVMIFFPENEPAFRLHVGLDNVGHKDVFLRGSAKICVRNIKGEKYVISPLWYGVGVESIKGKVLLGAGLSTAIDIAWRRVAERNPQLLKGTFDVNLTVYADGVKEIKRFIIYIKDPRDPSKVTLELIKALGRRKKLKFCKHCYMAYPVEKARCPYCIEEQERPLWWVQDWTPLKSK
jgi:hypothetical protein